MQTLVAYLKLSRLNNAALPIVGLYAGFVLVKATDYTYLYLAILALLLVHSAVTVWNDIADEASDQFNGITRIPRLRKQGRFGALKSTLYLSLALLAIPFVFLPRATQLLLLSSLLLGWAYNARPMQASHRPVLSIVLLGLSYGALPFLVGASFGHVSHTVIALATSWAIGRASLSMLKDFKDAAGDAQSNKRTFLLVYGGTLTARVSFILAALSYMVTTLIVCLTVTRSPSALLPLGVVAIWLLYERFKLFGEKHYEGLNQIFHDCVKYQLIFDGLVALCLHTL